MQISNNKLRRPRICTYNKHAIVCAIFTITTCLFCTYPLQIDAIICPIGRFPCMQNRSLVCESDQLRCNGLIDCDDQKDETLCDEHCGDNFPCKMMGCISWKMVCDDKQDCRDGSDEEMAACLRKTSRSDLYHCSVEEFACKHQPQCISAELVCDGFHDCADESDEAGCVIKEDCKYRCRNSNRCIRKTQICDGQVDCSDRSDELNCPKSCAADQLSCSLNSNQKVSGEYKFNDEGKMMADCYYLVQKCDGVQDCHNGADESNCSVLCSSKQFSCHNKRQCIDLSKHCDGINDCYDQSDENSCTELKPSVCDESSQFDCGLMDEAHCIPLTGVCNGRSECPNMHDERTDSSAENCNPEKNPCKKANGNCQQTCVNYFGKARCLCRAGYRSTSSFVAVNCTDINECAIWGKCPQMCQNTQGSYKCMCRHGYSMKYLSNGIEMTSSSNSIDNSAVVASCASNMDIVHSILYVTPKDIRIFSLKNRRLQVVYKNFPVYWIKSIDYKLELDNKKTIFWIENHDNHDCIYKSKFIDGEDSPHSSNYATEKHLVVEMPGNEKLWALSYDSIHDNLYATSHNAIIVINHEKKIWTKILHNDHIGQALLVVPFHLSLFYIDLKMGNIMRCDLNGDHVHDVVKNIESARHIRYMEWDTALERLVWLDPEHKFIASAHVAGITSRPDLEITVKLPLSLIPWTHPQGFTMFNEEYFWSDAQTQGSVFHISKFATTTLSLTTGDSAGTNLESQRKMLNMAFKNDESKAHALMMRIVHHYVKPLSYYSVCKNKFCSDICIPRRLGEVWKSRRMPVEATCFCQINSHLASNKVDCIKESNAGIIAYHKDTLNYNLTDLLRMDVENEISSNSLYIGLFVAFVIIAVLVLLIWYNRTRLVYYKSKLYPTNYKRAAPIHIENPVYKSPTPYDWATILDEKHADDIIDKSERVPEEAYVDYRTSYTPSLFRENEYEVPKY